MVAYFQNDTWKEDDLLRNEMKKYVMQALQREEILDFLKRDFSQYAWSRGRLIGVFAISKSTTMTKQCLWMKLESLFRKNLTGRGNF